MKFRLVYEGELRPTGRDPVGGQADPLAPHKHKIRQAFHRQLKHLWHVNKFLREHEIYRTDYATGRSIANDAAYYGSGLRDEKLLMLEAVAAQYHEYGYRFVPLVREQISLLCSLDILFLRRDIPGSVVSAGDIDNRLKTLIDGLRRPRNAMELAGNETPAEDEDPFFCLLEDDSQVSHLAVETDTLLDPPADGDADLRKARVIITVELRPYYVTTFNLSFA
jgi:hypothetical protein